MVTPPRALAALLGSALCLSIAGAQDTETAVSFEHDVRPILKAFCFDCHGAHAELEGGLDLRLRRFMASGGDSGPSIVPGDADASLLMQRVRDLEMPPGEKKLTAEQMETLRRWIDGGAKTLRDEPAELPPGIDITPEERAYWFYQPLVRPDVPATDPADRVRTPIDAFLVTAMKPVGLAFSPDADKATLLRRAAFDLTGLPPSAEHSAAYLADESPQAYEGMIDRLLESPAYGERWGRHWLDIAGYADSEGANVADQGRPYAYKYRDYVIRSLNADKPLNEFLVEQLAGDELVPVPHANLAPEQIEKLIATGFLRMAADGTGSGPADPELAKNQVVHDTLKIVGTSLFGLSLHCAQCHDHRYDPIPQADYYRLRAIFEPALDTKNWRPPAQRLVSLYTDADRAAAAAVEQEVAQVAAERATKQAEYMAAALEKELEKYPEPMRPVLREAYNTPADKRTAEQAQLLADNPSVNISPGVLYQYNQAAADDLKKYDERIGAIRAKKPVEDFVRVLSEVPGQVPATHVFYRGDHRQPTDEVAPGDLTIAAPDGSRFEIPADDPQLPTTGRRLALARWITRGDHPLVGRVLANRIWLHHFGRGIVDTPGDFGILGQRPTHPELLDWLACELPAQGWSLKQMHRLIMTSTAYRQSSQRDPAKEALDSENRYVWRMPVRRLEAEVIRDRLMATSGALDRSMFGPAVPVSEDDVGQVITPEDKPRRSIYLEVRRSKPVSFLTAFDAPVMETNCERRSSSTVAPQSLMLMNSDFILQQAAKMAGRVRSETPHGYLTELTSPHAERLRPRAEAWQFGYGQYDAAAGRVTEFQPLPHWTGSAWQGGPALPDPSLGWVIVRADGGHTGNDEAHAAIRRWTAPRAGRLNLSGTLGHGSPNGNGVRARVVSSRSGLLVEVAVHNGQVPTQVAEVEVQAGDTIDLVVDCQGDVTSDSFVWDAQLELAEAGQPLAAWSSTGDFHGPPGASLAEQVAYAWQVAYQRAISPDELQLAAEFCERQLHHLESEAKGGDLRLQVLTDICQTLLTSNEFLYID